MIYFAQGCHSTLCSRRDKISLNDLLAEGEKKVGRDNIHHIFWGERIRQKENERRFFPFKYLTCQDARFFFVRQLIYAWQKYDWNFE